jgi:hypothetical protein
MKHLHLTLSKKKGAFVFSLLLMLALTTSGLAFGQEGGTTGAGMGNAGLGAAGTIGPLGVTAIAAGTLAAVVVIAESVTDDNSTTPQHPTTPGHH